MSRPTSQHRLSVSSNASSLPARHSYSRTHSHSVSLGSLNANHRVTRRKSSSFAPGANSAALSAAVHDAVADGSNNANRRSAPSKAALGSLNGGSYPSVPSSLPQHASVPEHHSSNSSAVVDGPSLASMSSSKARIRRASEGTRLSKKEKTAGGDLKCETCGKGYKHSSCLTKHLWEHTPEWQYTSKLLISKHQQVQLLEAASVLVAMNQDGPELKMNDSDNSSSPAASGSSDLREDDLSSTETTPPPNADSYRNSKRYSNASSAYSRSYQSVFSDSAPGNDHGFAHYRNWSASSNNRPVTAGTSVAESYPGEDQADLAAAVGLLSCSYGTPKSGPTVMAGDVPPVPPLPAMYQTQSRAPPSSKNVAQYHGQEDVNMDDDASSDEEEARHHGRADEEDDGMFGTMDA